MEISGLTRALRRKSEICSKAENARTNSRLAFFIKAFDVITDQIWKSGRLLHNRGYGGKKELPDPASFAIFDRLFLFAEQKTKTGSVAKINRAASVRSSSIVSFLTI